MFCTLEIRQRVKSVLNLHLTLDIVYQYEYLGPVFTEHLHFEINTGWSCW